MLSFPYFMRCIMKRRDNIKPPSRFRPGPDLIERLCNDGRQTMTYYVENNERAVVRRFLGTLRREGFPTFIKL